MDRMDDPHVVGAQGGGYSRAHGRTFSKVVIDSASSRARQSQGKRSSPRDHSKPPLSTTGCKHTKSSKKGLYPQVLPFQLGEIVRKDDPVDWKSGVDKTGRRLWGTGQRTTRTSRNVGGCNPEKRIGCGLGPGKRERSGRRNRGSSTS